MPTWTSVDLLAALSPRRALYDCVSRFALLQGTIASLDASERELCGLADAVWTDGPKLASHLSVQGAKQVIVVGPGCHFERWSKAPVRGSWPPKRLGTFGTFGSPKDTNSLIALASSGYEVLAVGADPRGVFRGTGVEWVPPVEPGALPGLFESVDAFLMLYKVSRFNDFVVPAKTFECLATGLPVVISGLPSLEPMSHLFEAVEGPPSGASARIALRAVLDADAGKSGRLAAAKVADWSLRLDQLERELV